VHLTPISCAVPAKIAAAPKEIHSPDPLLWCSVQGSPTPTVRFMLALNAISIPHQHGKSDPRFPLYTQKVLDPVNGTYICVARNWIIEKDRGVREVSDLATIQVIV
jgi:hypothetical protein